MGCTGDQTLPQVRQEEPAPARFALNLFVKPSSQLLPCKPASSPHWSRPIYMGCVFHRHVPVDTRRRCFSNWLAIRGMPVERR